MTILTILFYIQHAIGSRVVNIWFFPGRAKKQKTILFGFFPLVHLGTVNYKLIALCAGPTLPRHIPGYTIHCFLCCLFFAHAIYGSYFVFVVVVLCV